jgi:hypothetical protein
MGVITLFLDRGGCEAMRRKTLLDRWDMPTEGDLRREADEAKYKKAKTEFLKEWISDNFDEFIATTPVNEYLHRKSKDSSFMHNYDKI